MATYAAYPNADGYWRATGTFGTTGTDFVAGNNYGAFFHWVGSGITSGATINSAVMDYTKNGGTGTCDINLDFEAADAATFPTSHTDASGRTLTGVPSNINAALSNARHATPDLSPSLQQVVDRPGFAGTFQLHWRNKSGTNIIQGRCIERTGTAEDPYLTVDYTEAATGAGNLLLLGVG